MSDFPCTDCGQEGRGPWAHSARCPRQSFKIPLEVCRVCRNVWLRKDQELCEYCAKKQIKKMDPLEEFWYGEESREKASRGTGQG